MLVGLEVFGQIGDSSTQHGYLNLRAAGVLGGRTEFIDDFLLGGRVKRHRFILSGAVVVRWQDYPDRYGTNPRAPAPGPSVQRLSVQTLGLSEGVPERAKLGLRGRTQDDGGLLNIVVHLNHQVVDRVENLLTTESSDEI